MENAARLFNTIRHLKPVQFYGRAWSKLYRPKPDLSPPPPLRSLSGSWRPSPEKPTALDQPWHFHFLNEEHTCLFPKDWNNPERRKLWLYNLHYFDDLNTVNAKTRKKWHYDLIEKWRNDNPPGQGNGWEPYPLSLRIVNWIKWALAGNQLNEKTIHNLAIQIRFLRKRLEFHLLGNHLLANAKALVYGGLFFDGPEATKWLKKGLGILSKQLPEQVLNDGGHFERSPMYHSIILEDLLDLINIMRTYGQTPPKSWGETATKMLNWLTTMIHPDGEIVLFNDSAFDIAPTPKQLFDYAGRLDIATNHDDRAGITALPDSGYIRYQNNDVVAFLDVGEIGPDYIPGHAHADTLSFELSLFGHRVIVDSGTSTYEKDKERLHQRSTTAHNTVVIDCQNSSEVWSSFRVARRAFPIDLQVEEIDDTSIIRCGHDGYQRLPGKPVHIRDWRFKENELEIIDIIQGPFREAIGRFHLHPDIKLSLNPDKTSGEVIISGDKKVSWQIDGGRCQIAGTTWHPEFGLSIPNKCIETTFTGPKCRVVFRWQSNAYPIPD